MTFTRPALSTGSRPNPASATNAVSVPTSGAVAPGAGSSKPNQPASSRASTSWANQPTTTPTTEAISAIAARRSTSQAITSRRLAPRVRITALASAWRWAKWRTASAMAAPASSTVTTEASPRKRRARSSARVICGLPSRTSSTRTSLG